MKTNIILKIFMIFIAWMSMASANILEVSLDKNETKAGKAITASIYLLTNSYELIDGDVNCTVTGSATATLTHIDRGIYSCRIIDNVAEKVTLTITAEKASEYKTVLTFTGVYYAKGAIYGENSNISVSPTEVIANGDEYSTIKVTLKDYYKDPILNATVILVGSNGTDSMISPVEHDGHGNYSFKVRSTVVENNVTYTAIANAIDENGNNSTLTQISPKVDFVPYHLPDGVTMDAGQVKYVVSVYDNDYAPYKSYTQICDKKKMWTTIVDADGKPDKLVNIQGYITQQGVSIEIPYHSNRSVRIPAFKAGYTVPGYRIEGNVSKRVYLEYPAQTIRRGSGKVKARIFTKGSTVKIKRLDINVGIGDGTCKITINYENGKQKSVYGALFADFNISVNSAGDIGAVQVRGMVGIPDRMFGKPDINGNTNTHMFLYLPVKSNKTGLTWLNNNLGADYANLNSPYFNLAKQATSPRDIHAFGSHFQWGRKADGHELIRWTSLWNKQVGTTVWSTVSKPYSKAYFYNWTKGLNNSLWSRESSKNNICPVGYRLPTLTGNYSGELAREKMNWSSKNGIGAFSSTLKLTMAGIRTKYNWVIWAGILARYASSNSNTYCGWYYSNSMSFDNYTATLWKEPRAFGNSVRCIKD